MMDFRPEDFDQAFSQLNPLPTQSEPMNRIPDAGSDVSGPLIDGEQTRLEFETTGETARKRGFGLFHLRVVAFVIR